MLRALFLPAAFLLFSISLCLAQSSSPAQNPPSAAPAKPAAPAAPASAAPTPAPDKRHKKVWTNDDIASAGGAISVVGSASSASDSSPDRDNAASVGSAHDRKVAAYRTELRRLQSQLDVAEKKLSELRHFNGDNAAGSGGINIHQRYSMTPVADQIKQLEAQTKQLQDRIGALQDAARKDGIEPGELR